MKTRARQRAAKRERKMTKRSDGAGESKYARKKKWLNSNGMWGFDVPSPKPWR